MIFDAHTVAAVLSSFLASAVEVTEAYTIILAVGLTRGWRPALIGSGAALALLAFLVLLFGPLLSTFDLSSLQFVVGCLLLVFGLGWLRKAILRAAGVMALHDENLIFEREAAQLSGREVTGRFDAAGMVTAFQGMFLEGLEVVFIVIAVGVGKGLLGAASAGAALACVVILGAGFVLHRPLSQIPENALKFAVGVMLASFGLFWAGEGLGLAWPGGDLALGYLSLVFLTTSLGAAYISRKAIV